MAANTIGSVTAQFLYGKPPVTLKQVAEVYRRPGMNGIGVRQTGTGEGAFALRAVFFDAESTVTTAIAALEALVGTIVTINDAFDDAHTNCLIEQVTPADKKAVIGAGSVDTMAVMDIVGRVVS